MNEEQLKEILARVQAGLLPVDGAISELRDLPFKSLGYANADVHRKLRTGYAEVVFGPGKTAEQIAEILTQLGKHGGTVFASRVAPDVANEVLKRLPTAEYLAIPRMIVLGSRTVVDRGRGTVAILTAGTSDIPVAEEAAVTAELDGNRVERIFDVGVAGLHRLLAHREQVEAAEVLVVVAGMDGVLPTVTAGLFSRPVIAVPTSVGYGASFAGVAALLTMLNACASGVSVVNIDNGFGAGRIASMINRKRP